MDYTIRDPGKPIRLVLASRKVEELEAMAGMCVRRCSLPRGV